MLSNFVSYLYHIVHVHVDSPHVSSVTFSFPVDRFCSRGSLVADEILFLFSSFNFSLIIYKKECFLSLLFSFSPPLSLSHSLSLARSFAILLCLPPLSLSLSACSSFAKRKIVIACAKLLDLINVCRINNQNLCYGKVTFPSIFPFFLNRYLKLAVSIYPKVYFRRIGSARFNDEISRKLVFLFKQT